MNPQQILSQRNTGAPAGLSNYGDALTGATQALNAQNAPTPVTPHEDWWQKLLPTAGGILGGIGGTLLAGPLGGIAGAGLLGGVGKGVEDATSGNTKDVLGDVVNSGIENAGGQVVGGVLGKVAGKVLGGAAGMADSTVPKLLQGQVAKGTLDDATAKYLSDNGITDMRTIAHIHPIVTGPDGAINGAVENSLLNAGDDHGLAMDLSSLASQGSLPGQAVGDALTKVGLGATPEATSGVQKIVQGILQKYNPDAVTSVAGKGGATVGGFDNGVLNSQSPLTALQISRDLYNAAGNVTGANKVGMSQALKSMANNINDNLYGPATAVGKLGISDQVKADALQSLQPLAKINPQLFNSLTNQVNNATTIGELRSAQQPLVKAAQALDYTTNLKDGTGDLAVADALKNGSSIASGASQGGIKGGALALGARALQSEGAQRAGTGLLSQLSDVLGNQTMQKAVQGGVKGVTMVGANASNYVNPATGADALQGGDMNQPQGSGNIMADIMNSNAPGALPIKMALIDSMYRAPGQADPMADPQMAQAMQGLQSVASAKAQLGSVMDSYNQAGGAQGPIMGLLAQLGGAVTGGNAAHYQNQADQLANTIQQLTGRKVAMPTLTMNGDAANSTMAQLRAALGSYL